MVQSATTALSTQQLAEFLAVVSALPDGPSVTRAATERAARALEAEVAAVVVRNGVLASVGYPAGRVPDPDLAAAATGRCRELQVPGAGTCRAVSAPFGGRRPGHLVVARSGADGFTVDEVSLVRGMARVLELTLETLSTLAGERQQAAENARLLASLQERQRLLEQLSAIQRAIARRAPLQQILDTITAGAQELLGDDVIGLRLLDADDPRMLLLVSSSGFGAEEARRLWRVPLGQAGAAGPATLSDDLVVLNQYAASPYRIPELTHRLHAAMAAPVHDNGNVVGSLEVATLRPDRVYGAAEQKVLLAFAEHVSLAVTDAKTLEAMYQAFHDSLTGLASRGLFLDRLEHGLACAAREGSSVAVLFVDLDRFKTVNDSLGHGAGDVLLIGVAERLRSCLRASDTAARIGGDEFAVLLPDVAQPDQPVVVAERVIAALRAPFALGGKEVFINCSVGIAFNELGGQDAEALVQNADLAMYEAKKNGKGRYEIFQPSMEASLRRNLDLEAGLRGAVDREEFALRYQPIVELATGRVTGVEALLRWDHPERGLLGPTEFIPVAEEAGLIAPIGNWVLYQACRQASRWAAAGTIAPVSMSVNLSARQLQQHDLPARVAAILTETGLDPGALVLEITESLLLHETETVLRRLRQLKGLGVRLAFDDFGTGYSSLSYLRRFPVDVLKIDKSFVDDLGSGPDAAALSRAIVHLGRALGLETVAEGIETAAQVDELRASGCRLGQGYYFARPLERADAEALLLGGAVPFPAPVPPRSQAS